MESYENSTETVFEEKKYRLNNMDTELYSNGLGIDGYEGTIAQIVDKMFEVNKPGLHSTPFEKIGASALLSQVDRITVITNELISTYISELDKYMAIEEFNDRFMAILLNLQTLFAFINKASNHFISTKGELIEVKDFYKLYNCCVKYYETFKEEINTEDSNKCLDRLVSIFTNYTVYASTYGDVKFHNQYMKSIIQIFDKVRTTNILTSMSIRAFYSETCDYSQVANFELSEALQRLKVTVNIEDLIIAFKISNLIYKNTDQLCDMFYENRISLTKKASQFELCELYRLMCENSQYCHTTMIFMKEEIISNDTYKSISFRMNQLYVMNLIQSGEISKAKREFYNLCQKFKCNSTFRAITYISILEKLGLLVEEKGLFTQWYHDYLLQPFIDEGRLNINNVIPLIIMQSKISLINNLEMLQVLYNKYLKRSDTVHESKRLIVINPLHDLNIMYAPLHIYRTLVHEKNIPILNLSVGQINFFNEHQNNDNNFLPLLNVDNSGVVDNPKHWNSDFSKWEVDFYNKVITCNGVDLYQSFFETIARNQKVFTFDWKSPLALYYFHLFKRRVDRNAYVYAILLKKFQFESIIHITNMHHYAPWSYFYRRSLQKDNAKRESLVQVAGAYGNYVDSKVSTYEAVTALNLTKYKKSRIAVFGGSEAFSLWAQSEIGKVTDEFIEKYILEQKKPSMLTLSNKDADGSTLYPAIQKAKKEGKVIACILGKRLCDLCVPRMEGTFENMKVWAYRTNQFVLQSDDVFLIVKPHPVEIMYEISQVEMESFLDWFSEDKKIYKLRHNECSMDDLIPYVDCFLLWNGTSVLNLAIQKANIIVCDDWANMDYPIGLYQPKNVENYFEDIRNAKQWKESEQVILERAKKAYLFSKYLKDAEFAVSNVGISRSATNVNWNVPNIQFDVLEDECKCPQVDYQKVIQKVLEH